MEKQSLTQSIECVYPWNGLAVRPDGTAIPCCMYNDQNNLNFKSSNLSMEDLRNSEVWRNIRNDMLNNKFPMGCMNCKNDEELGLQSLRINGLKRFIPIKTVNADKIKILEIAFSNLCDTACMHCSSKYSSRWGDGKVSHEYSAEDIDVSELQYLKIIGGEPLLEQDKFNRLLDRIDVSHLMMQICTNGRSFPNSKLQTHIDNSKTTLIVVSMDGMEGLNDWFRWPSNWNKLEGQFKKYDERWGDSDNVYLHFHCCVNIYNIFYLDEIVQYVLEKWPNWKIEWDWINWPQWQSINIIPEPIRSELKQTLLNCSIKYPDLTRLCDTNPFNISLNRLNHPVKPGWNMSIENTLRFAKERKLDLQTLIPKFFNLI